MCNSFFNDCMNHQRFCFSCSYHIQVVHCIKKPEQILPYAIINLKKDFLTQNFVVKNNQVPQDQRNNYNEDIGFENLHKNWGV